MGETLSAWWHQTTAIEHLAAWLALGWAVYVVWLGAWIILQKREPAATLSWLVSLAALPYLGFAIYFFFGPQRIRRQRLRRDRSRTRMPALPAGRVPDAAAIELARMAQTVTGLPPSTATRADLLIDGSSKYQRLNAEVALAREHVHLEYYIFQPDRTGTALRDALIERARAGVRVRLLLDAVGSGSTSRAFLKPLVEAGGEVAWFHPMRLHWFWQRPWLNLRSHRKIVVIDGRVGFIGGINITDEEDESLGDNAYRDLHLRLEGDVVRSLQLVFLEDWVYATGDPPPPVSLPESTPGDIRVQMVVSGPDSPWEAIHRLHVSAIHAARQRVWLVTPYFVPGEAAMMALTSAALGGVDVRLLVPKHTDSRLVTYAARSYFDDLMAAGVKVLEYGPRMLHTKALLCDDDLAIIGSANFDHRSFRLNFESSVLFRDRTVVAELARLIENDCMDCTPVTADRQRGLWRSRLPEALARLMSPLL
ncbi:cardiolipin synthase [Lysobacter ciconiae]|uniref:Cardiolipin synthase n=1 Tax=Novilysobacter ciconiae TaxID=2781022 RepID=A0A7S6UFV7_9GAMM|nr:cardiolipin synthase [Lysobacter ciconiae]QOW19542.1 cardiolipin synthase [Lysobacter ciconiae]